jgi:hypothetical protein
MNAETAEHAETVVDDSKSRGETLDASRRRVERLLCGFRGLCVDRRDR